MNSRGHSGKVYNKGRWERGRVGEMDGCVELNRELGCPVVINLKILDNVCGKLNIFGLCSLFLAQSS